MSDKKTAGKVEVLDLEELKAVTGGSCFVDKEDPLPLGDTEAAEKMRRKGTQSII